jgi:hypothetical protein
MPIEIRELIIKAKIGRDESPRKPGNRDEKDTSLLVREAVEKTLETLSRNEER